MIDKLQRDLSRLGIHRGDTVMMHSSYKSLGEGITPADFFQGFLDLLGEEGTLVLPALSYETVTYEHPFFDRSETPSCVGYLSEFFRTQVTGVRRSLHATHSCTAVGKHADFLLNGHEKDLTPVGANSPISKLPQVNGKMLMLGCHPDHNTALHGVEEKGGAPYIFDPTRRISYVLKDGEQVIHQTARRHDFHKTDCDYEQKYARILDLLDEGVEYTRGKVLAADCYLLSARAVWEKGLAKLAEDPCFFVNKVMK
ncbi:MAG: AAC(3) family N-acetyltransferase [Ruminococcaceae bacterium]|nr:AAC(3) family N-acetyltransferase [Oscillospiraceae bacterium]